MRSKEERIAELKKQILEIENEVDMNYELVEVVPDCGGGIMDSKTTLAISTSIDELVSYCEENFKYTPKFKRGKDGLSPCATWYMLHYTKIQIL